VRQFKRIIVVITICWWFAFESVRDWRQWRERKGKT
jgi:hypothetical protein